MILAIPQSGSTPVGWVEPRNPTIPALTERSINTVGHFYTIPIIKISNIQSIFDRLAYRTQSTLMVLGFILQPNLQILSLATNFPVGEAFRSEITKQPQR
jgi:hypothetical protein